MLRVNLLSAFWMTKALAAALKDSAGAVVNTVSVSAFGGGASSTAYATAKAGLAGLTRELARGLAPAVRVNGIAPGVVNSNWQCSFGDLEALARATVPLARVGEPEDYAELIVYLCAGASYITGEVIPITGGLRL
jgi:3-oxoacyl-[acyl-carrier protein] reductase